MSGVPDESGKFILQLAELIYLYLGFVIFLRLGSIFETEDALVLDIKEADEDLYFDLHEL